MLDKLVIVDHTNSYPIIIKQWYHTYLGLSNDFFIIHDHITARSILFLLCYVLIEINRIPYINEKLQIKNMIMIISTCLYLIWKSFLNIIFSFIWTYRAWSSFDHLYIRKSSTQLKYDIEITIHIRNILKGICSQWSNSMHKLRVLWTNFFTKDWFIYFTNWPRQLYIEILKHFNT